MKIEHIEVGERYFYDHKADPFHGAEFEVDHIRDKMWPVVGKLLTSVEGLADPGFTMFMSPEEVSMFPLRDVVR